MNAELVQREPNFIAFKYKKIMSFLFLISSVFTLYLFAAKIYPMQRKHRGFVRDIIFANLLCLVLYNLTYSFESYRAKGAMARFMDSMINSLMMSLFLFLNLVLIDAQTDKVTTSMPERSLSIFPF